MTVSTRIRALSAGVILSLGLTGCLSEEPEGIATSKTAKTTVKLDFEHRPLPDIPLPNDVATRYDKTSPTLRRINASMVAPTELEMQTRRLIDTLDGWGALQPITIPFTGPLSIESITNAHRDADYDLSDDVIYLIDIDPDSPEFGDVKHLDIGNGNYPVILEQMSGYWRNDPRAGSNNIFFEEIDEDRNGNGVLDDGEDHNGNRQLDEGEDRNGNGVLDPPEDTDADGTLDKPNYYPGANPAWGDLGGRADALMTFYERETNTLILRPMVPLRERTTYAVVVTRRLLDADGEPVGSPYPFVHHASQTEALKPLSRVLPDGVSMSDVAFAFTYTVQTLESDWIAIRDGLYGHGVQKHIGEEFPANVASLFELMDTEHRSFRDVKNPFILYIEEFLGPFRLIATGLLGRNPDSVSFRGYMESLRYVDFFVEGTYKSPQLFERDDPNKDPNLPPKDRWLPYNLQSWPPDLSTTPAPLRSEDVHFWLAVPRKEVSARGQGGMPPIVVLGHGYTSNRFSEISAFAGYLAQHGMAVIGIDCVSHGISVSNSEKEQALDILGRFGLGPFVDVTFTDRAYELNGDDRVDSGADFWTGYVFHTRDVVRQCGLDYMQLIRIIKSWDGEKRFNFDVNGDGENDLAGDFDADGVVDVGINSEISMTGGSLGGIMSLLVGSLEPHVTASVPVSGGGGLGDVGVRTQQSGVREAVILRAMGPLFLATYNPETQKTLVETIVPDLNDIDEVPLAELDDVRPGDTMRVENLKTGEIGCAYILAQPDGRGLARMAVASDKGDPLRIAFYSGPRLVPGDEDCALRGDSNEVAVVDTFEQDFEFQAEATTAGTPLTALAEGLGLRRSNPELRRFLGLAQLVLDSGDPGTYLRHMSQEPLTFPGTGQTTGTHALIITTTGDMNVPASTGVSAGRNAGIIPYLENDPEWGKPLNQVLIDFHVAEAVNILKRYVDGQGTGVHMDVENFSEGEDIFGPDIPRLDNPLRIGFDKQDPLGGYSAAVFPYTQPTGAHGFEPPGDQVDDFVNQCRAACPEEGECDCPEEGYFDIGYFMFNLLGSYMSSGGKSLEVLPCFGRNDCDTIPPVPEERDGLRN